MAEDLDDHRRVFDRGDDLQGAAAVRAVFDVDVEDPFEQPGLAHARRRASRVSVIARELCCMLYRTRDNFRTQLCVGREHAMGGRVI